jgi:hypothetical protein
VIERLVENWLTSAGERGFEVPFAQLLTAEDHRVIQGPVHHPFEHGKDILTFAPNGELHAYQLKGPDLVKLEDFERIQGQLLALAGTAITHPAVAPARRADRVFLVTNAALTPPVRDRIEKFNMANVPGGWPPIEPIEREQLLARFMSAHGNFLPQSLPDIRSLLELYYADPASLFPVRSFAAYLTAILPFPPQHASQPECRRAIASATLLTAYAASSWTRAENHLCVAQAWLTVCITVIRFAAVRGLDEKLWSGSYELALEAARTAVASLSQEASAARDLIVPDMMDGMVYGSRALLVCGFLSAYFLSERTLGAVDAGTRDRVNAVLTREAPYVKVVGESDVPALLAMASALEHLGEMRTGEQMILSLVNTLSKINQRHSPAALADPYHNAEQVLLRHVGADSDLEGEEFDGRSYMLNVAVEWLARRLWRQHLAAMWSDITRVQCVEFQPSAPDAYLAVKDESGELKMWFAGQPHSWAALLRQSRQLETTRLPDVLWARRELIPYLPLLFPYRLTATLSGVLDTIASDPVG